MQRFLTENLAEWKASPYRKPLILYGMRQVGKTWLLKAFGAEKYRNTAYFSFDNNARLRSIFDGDFDTERIIRGLEIEADAQISPGETLAIFDEVQECPRAVTALKYFCENASEYHIAAAGSLLGVASFEGTGFPVGKVDMLTLCPMTFLEFLDAVGGERFARLIRGMETAHLEVFKDKIVEYLSQYLYTGGMPLAVKMYADTRNFGDVREVQDVIIKSYYADFAKHIPGRDIAKVRQIWDSVPAQLGKENKRFLYSDMKAGSRGRDFETALQWLVDSGLVLRLNRVSLPNLPLAGYAESAVFKLYLPDVGLLSALTGLGPRTYLEGPKGIFNHFKGVLAEQFVLQELRANAPHPPVYYWANGKNTAEIEFVIQSENQIIPIEVKAGKNIKSKSLAVYREQFAPETAIQTSLEDFEKAGSLCRIPLFAIGQWRGWLLQHGEETARRRSG